jgi:HSP20 family protein
MGRLHEEMSRFFDRWGGTGLRRNGRVEYPALNLWEDDESLFVEAELPGFELDSLEIFVNGDNQLSLKGERKPPEVENGTWHRQERGHGSFQRMIDLPHYVDSSKVTAQLTNGVLTVTLPKREESKPRRIEVKAE